MMSSSIIGVIAQRLARRICQNCKDQYVVDETTAEVFGYSKDNLPTFYKGNGCDRCGGTGYKGRVALYEVLVMNDELRRLVSSGANVSEIRECAVKDGMITLQKYAEYLLLEGLTTVDAVLGTTAVSE